MFQAKRFLLDKFVSPDRLIAFMAAYGFPPPGREAAYKWFQRGVIPAAWFPLLLCTLELDEGRPIALASYVETRQSA